MNITIIDDDPISIFLTEQSLLQEGFKSKLRAYLSAEEALQELKNQSIQELPDVIFLDLNMPSMNGWQFLENFRLLPVTIQEKCAIYILTSSLDIADTKRANENMFVKGVIHKPVTPADLGAILLPAE